MDGNPSAGPASISEALDRARALALDRYRTEVRALAVEIASARSLVAISDELEASIARDAGELPFYAAEIGARNELEPYRRKLSFMWWRLGNGGYADPDRLLADIRLIRDSLRANGGRRDRGRPRRAARADDRGLRVPPREARRTTACPRPRQRPCARRRCRGRRRSASAPRAAGDRHPDRLGDVLSGGRAARAAGCDAVFASRRCSRRWTTCEAAPAIVEPAPLRTGPASPARGDGRLLGLRQGQRVPGRAVGDLPRAGGACRSRRAARRRADDLPRPRRQRRPRRRPDTCGDRFPAGRPSSGPAEADRAGRDDLVQVQPRRSRASANLEAALAGTLLATYPELLEVAAVRRRPHGCSTGSASVSRSAYRAFVWEDARFVPFFRAFTPVDELSQLQIGVASRAAAARTRTTSRHFARSRGCSRGRRTACCYPPGSALVPPSPRVDAGRAAAISTAACRSCARSSTTWR